MHERLLTLRQPHADLAVAGIKSPENRSWRVPSTLPQWGRCTDCRLRLPAPMNTGACPSCDNFRGAMEPDGPFPFRVYILAGLTDDRDQDAWAEWCRLADLDAPEFGPMPDPDDVTRGAVVGSVLVTGCHHADECEDCPRARDGRPCAGPSCEHEACSRWALPDCWHFELDQAVRFGTPIPWTGGLGLRHVPDDLRDLITQQTGATA